MSALVKYISGFLVMSLCSASYSQEGNSPNYTNYKYSRNGLRLSEYSQITQINIYEVIESNCYSTSTVNYIGARCLNKIKVTLFDGSEALLEQITNVQIDKESGGGLDNFLFKIPSLIETVARTPEAILKAKNSMVEYMDRIVAENRAAWQVPAAADVVAEPLQ